MNPTSPVQNNPNPTFKELALPWVARGFKAIPVARGAKRPVWTGWPQISETETVDQMQARCDNDRRFPRWNCGLMADPNFHCVLDCDSPGLVEQIERETGHKIPETLTVKSAGKGCPHFYFLPTPKSHELNNKSAVSTEGHSFDFWVWHQQTLAPGSIKEPTGSRYELIRDVPMVPIPDWLVDWIAAQHRAHSDASGDVDAGALGQLKAAYQRNLNPEDMYNIDGLAIDSCQHPTIHSLACFIWDGKRDEQEMVEILETIWNTYCSRGYEQATSENGLSEIERIVQNVMEKDPCLPSRACTITFGGKASGPTAATTKNNGVHRLQLTSFAGMQSKVVDWYWPGRLARGHITTFNGDPGTMKSFASIDMAARVTTGRAFPDGSKNPLPASHVVILTREDGLEDTVKPRFLAAGGDPKFLHTITLAGSTETAVVKIEEHLAELDALLPASTRLIIFDPLIDFLKAGQNDEQAVRDTLTELKQFAERRDLAVIGINHLNKKSDLEAIHRAMGAKGMIGVARMNYLFGKDEQGTRHMVTLKNNVWHEDGSLTFHVEDSTVEDGGLVITKIGRIAWDGKGAVTADELSAPKKKPAIDVVGDWLKEMLMPVGTKRPSDDLYAAGQELGISEDQIKRGLKRMNATYERTKTVPPKTVWYFPEVGW